MYTIRFIPTACTGALPAGELTVTPLGQPPVTLAPGVYEYQVDLQSLSVEELSHTFRLRIPGYANWTATVLLPDTLHQFWADPPPGTPPPTVFEVPILFQEAGVPCEAFPPDPCFVWLQAQCSSTLSFFPGFAVEGGTITWTFGDGTTRRSPGGLSHTYRRAGRFDVTVTVETCDWTEEEYCCYDGAYERLVCDTLFFCDQQVEVTSFYPEALFAIDCTNPNATNQIRRQADCIQGCYGCDCEDAAFCRCVAVGQPVRFVPIIDLNINHCLFEGATPLEPEEELTARVRWFVNDELILEVTDIAQMGEPFVREFDREGRYRIRIEVCNCCGCCEFEETISVGPSLFLQRTGCHTMSIVDWTNYAPTDRQRVTITTLDGKTVAQYLLPSNPTVPAVISVSRDGVYIVSVELIDPFGVVLRSRRFVWYEFCHLLDCYHELVRKAACTDCKCDDPVEEAETQKKIDRFLMLAGAFFASIDVQFGNTYGLLYYEERFLGVLRDHRALLDALLDVCGRCGVKVNVGEYKANCNSCRS